MIYKFKDGRKGYYFSFYLNGKRYKKEKYNGQRMLTKGEALAAEQDYKKSLNNNPEDITFYELYEQFIETKKNIKISSFNHYVVFKRNHLVLFPNKSLNTLQPIDFQKWKQTIISLGHSTDYTNTTLQIMNKCLEFGSIMYNLNGNLRYAFLEPYKDYSVSVESKKKYLPETEFQKILNEFDENVESEYYYKTILYILYNTGLRIGELAALTIDDVRGDKIFINKDLIRLNGQNYIQTPKSKNSIRTVIMNDDVSCVLNNYINKMHPDGIIFHRDSEYINQQKLRRMLHKAASSAGISEHYEIKLHNLRHSRASNLRNNNFDVHIISSQLGNTPTVANDIYIHATDEELIKKIKGMK